MRLPVALSLAASTLLLPLAASADEVDLAHAERRNGAPPEFILRAEGGNAFSPYGYTGVAFSWLSSANYELEAGLGAGFPGLQLGLAARTLFGIEEGKYALLEIALAGNTRTNRGGSDVQGPQANSSFWSSLGLGGEIRQGFYSINLVAGIVFTTNDFSPHFGIHGGIGFGL